MSLTRDINVNISEKWAAYFTANSYDNIKGAIRFKADMAKYVIPHSINYNGEYMLHGAMTFTQPWLYSSQDNTICRREYTVVEVAPEKYDYIIHRRTYVRGKPSDVLQSYIYRPYADSEFCEQLLDSSVSEAGQLTRIDYGKSCGSHVWDNTVRKQLQYADPCPEDGSTDDDEAEIDWAEDHAHESQSGKDDTRDFVFTSSLNSYEDDNGNILWGKR